MYAIIVIKKVILPKIAMNRPEDVNLKVLTEDVLSVMKKVTRKSIAQTEEEEEDMIEEAEAHLQEEDQDLDHFPEEEEMDVTFPDHQEAETGTTEIKEEVVVDNHFQEVYLRVTENSNQKEEAMINLNLRNIPKEIVLHPDLDQVHIENDQKIDVKTHHQNLMTENLDQNHQMMQKLMRRL